MPVVIYENTWDNLWKRKEAEKRFRAWISEASDDSVIDEAEKIVNTLAERHGINLKATMKDILRTFKEIEASRHEDVYQFLIDDIMWLQFIRGNLSSPRRYQFEKGNRVAVALLDLLDIVLEETCKRAKDALLARIALRCG